MKYSLKEIRKKQSLAEKYHLEGRELLKDCDAVQKYCNGIGADWMPAWLRRITTCLFPSLVIAADIHDIRYGQGGTHEDRVRADAEFLVNVEFIAFSRNRLRRAVIRRIGWKMYAMISVWGRLSWKERQA